MLPRAEQTAPVKERATWSAMRGALFAFFLVLTASSGITLGTFLNKYFNTPAGLDRQGIIDSSREAVTGASDPSQLLLIFGMYQEAGLDPRIPPIEYRDFLNRKKYLTWAIVMAIPTAVGLIGLLLVAVRRGRTA